MKTFRRHYWYSVVLCLGFWWVMALGEPVFAGDAIITGTVTDAQTGAPQSSVMVSLFWQAEPDSTFQPLVAQVSTDAKGVYTATNLNAGIYRIQFGGTLSSPYYLSQYYDSVTSNNPQDATPVTVIDGVAVTNINAQLVRGGAVTGTVTSIDGMPLGNINVGVQRKVLQPDGNEQWEGFINVPTNEAGQYHVKAMPTGLYRIVFSDQQWPRRYVDEFYDNATNWAGAMELFVQASSVTANINAQLDRLGMITGNVTDNTGNPVLPGVVVGYYQYFVSPAGNNDWYQSSNRAVVQPDGSYRLESLSPGAYRLYFNDTSWPRLYSSQFYRDALDLESAQTITVTANTTITNIDVQMAITGRITGAVTDRDGVALANIQAIAEKFVPDANGGVWMPASQSISDSEGRYTIPSLEPGNYRVQFQDARSPALYYQVVLPNTITVAAGTVVTDINAALDAKGAISGTVTDGQGAPLANIAVYLEYTAVDHPDEFWLWGIVPTDESGHYYFEALEENRFRLFFKDERSSRQYATEYYNDAPTADTATIVKVISNTITSGIDAQLADLGGATGLVTDEHGQPLTQIQVILYQINDSVWSPTNFVAVTDDAGRYRLAGIDPGVYRFGFHDTRAPGEYATEYYVDSTLAAATDVTISSGTSITINAQLGARGHISGVITDADGQPLSGMRIGAGFKRDGIDYWENVVSTSSDETGNYTLAGLEPGQYRVCFSDAQDQHHYSYECYDNAPTIERANDVTVQAGTTTTINAELAATGGISGVVTDEAGNPLPWIQVQLWFDPQGTGQWMLDAVHWSYPDENGNYLFTGLDVGKYRMRFVDPGGSLYAPEFYNDALFLADATDITVAPDEITPDINAQMGPYSHITGKVTGENGEPLTTTIRIAAVQLRPVPHGYDSWERVREVDTDSEGHYNLTGLIKGVYRIWFHDPFTHYYHEEYYDNQGYPDHGVDIQVGVAMTVTDINAQLVPYDTLDFPPLARNDYIFVHKGGMTTTVGYDAPSLLVNDRDDKTMTLALTATLVTSPTHGTIMLNSDGTFTYTHNADSATVDYFTYKVNDGVYDSNVATVTVAITQTTPGLNLRQFLPLIHK